MDIEIEPNKVDAPCAIDICIWSIHAHSDKARWKLIGCESICVDCLGGVTNIPGHHPRNKSGCLAH